MTARFDFTVARSDEPGRWRMPEWMRREIDARVARGEVTRCPACTFAAPEWAPEADPAASVVEVAPGKVVKAGGGWRGKRPGVAERRAKVLALADGTRTSAEIAEALGVTWQNVRNDIQRLRAQGHEPRIAGYGGKPRIAPGARQRPAGPAAACGPREAYPFRGHRTVAELPE